MAEVDDKSKSKTNHPAMRSVSFSGALFLSLAGFSGVAGLSSPSSSEGYLSSLSRAGGGALTMEPPLAVESVNGACEGAAVTFSHAPLTYFALDKLTPKGPRKNADVGQPHDATRPLVKVGSVSSGSWWCAEGGWPSPALRATTEVFFVFSGRGCVTDLDGARHEFGVGDTVVLPKGWSGRGHHGAHTQGLVRARPPRRRGDIEPHSCGHHALHHPREAAKPDSAGREDGCHPRLPEHRLAHDLRQRTYGSGMLDLHPRFVPCRQPSDDGVLPRS